MEKLHTQNHTWCGWQSVKEPYGNLTAHVPHLVWMKRMCPLWWRTRHRYSSPSDSIETVKSIETVSYQQPKSNRLRVDLRKANHENLIKINTTLTKAISRPLQPLNATLKSPAPPRVLVEFQFHCRSLVRILFCSCSLTVCSWLVLQSAHIMTLRNWKEVCLSFFSFKCEIKMSWTVK